MTDTISNIQELELRQQELLASLSPFFPFQSDELPEDLRGLDRNLFERLAVGCGFQDGQTGTCPEAYRFIVETLQSTQQGRKLCLLSDLDLLEKVHSTGQDYTHLSPFGTLEGLFPVYVNGAIVWIVWTGKMFTESMDEEFIQFLSETTGISTDILTERSEKLPCYSDVESERALQTSRKTRDLLQAALQAEVRNQQLSKQLLESERLRSLGTLSSGVAHHFNNLLSVILGYSSFVSNREKLSEKATQALRQISEAAQKGRRLTEEILAFSGSEEEEHVESDVHETLSNVLSLLQSQVSSRVRISKQLTATHHLVQAPPSVIHQIVFNLLTNSIDSMAEGGSLTVTSENQTLGGDQTEYLSIQLTDTGDGFPHGFDPLITSTEQAQEGAERDVLKLSSVYGMVERLDGTVTVATSATGENTVEVILPVATPSQDGDGKSPVNKRLTPSDIWVIDDDPIFRQMCRQVLQDDGHDVAEYTTGTEFMEGWEKTEKKPDLLILDFSMPEYNGLEVRQWLDQKNADLAVILVSGFAATHPDIKEALGFKKTFFLQKPFAVPELADIVTVALGETLIGE